MGQKGAVVVVDAEIEVVGLTLLVLAEAVVVVVDRGAGAPFWVTPTSWPATESAPFRAEGSVFLATVNSTAPSPELFASPAVIVIQGLAVEHDQEQNGLLAVTCMRPVLAV
jgi:hypothetical protein